LKIALVPCFPDVFIVDFLQSLAILRLTMTAYGFAHSRRVSLTSTTTQEKKEARKKLLEAVFARRKENYKHLMKKKHQLQADSEMI